MIKIKFTCAACGHESPEFEIQKEHSDPFYGELGFEVRRFTKQIGWVFQESVCGDIYCSKECAQ